MPQVSATARSWQKLDAMKCLMCSECTDMFSVSEVSVLETVKMTPDLIETL